MTVDPSELPPGLDPVIQIVGQWAITEYGMESIARYEEGGFIEYPIEKKSLWETDWIDHMSGKRWVILSQFKEALFRARQIHAYANPTPSINKVKARKRYEILRRDEFRCQLCGRSSLQGAHLEVDHIVPQSKGGTDEPSNLRTLCSVCNNGRSNQP